MELTRKGRIIGTWSFAGFILLAAVVVFVMHGRRSGEAEEADVLSVEDLKPTRAPLPTPAAASSEIDLLDLIQVPRDGIAGSWGFRGRSLFTSSTPWGRIQIRCTPPEEYDLKLTAVRRTGMNSLNVGFVHEGRQGMVIVDGNEGQTTWMDLATAPDPSANETTRVGRHLQWRRNRTLLLSVRKTGVVATVDGKKILDWKGDSRELALLPGWRVPHTRTLLLGSWDSVFEITEMKLIPVTGNATILQ